MGIATQIVNGLTEMVTGSAQAIGSGASALLVEEVDGVKTLTTAGEAIFTIVGIGFGVGLMGVIFNLIRFR